MLKKIGFKILYKINTFRKVKLPGAEGFSEYLEDRFGMDLVVMGPKIVEDEEILKKLNTNDQVKGWELFSNRKHFGYYFTIDENKEGDFGRIYEGELGESNPQLGRDEFTLMYWNQTPPLHPGQPNKKLKNYQRIDGHYNIPFPN